jgi:hypothetical protein
MRSPIALSALLLIGFTLFVVLAFFGDLLTSTGRIRDLSITQCDFPLAHTALTYLPALVLVGLVSLVGSVFFLGVSMSKRAASLVALLSLAGVLLLQGDQPVYAQSSQDCLRLGGGTMQADINMGNNDLTNVGTVQFGTNINAATPATVVVCASNARSTERCDYVADGTADDVQIQAAINALPAAGGTVVLSEGTFHVQTSNTINLVSNATLKGQGRSTILSMEVDGGVNDVYAVKVRGSGAGSELTSIGLFDFQVKGQEHAVNTKNQHGLHLKNAHHIRYDNLHFENLSEEGLVHDENVKFVQGGKISGKDLGSSVMDIGGNTFHIQIEDVFGEDTNQVESTATVNIASNTITPVGEYYSIGTIISLNSGARAVQIKGAKHVSIGQIIARGANTGVSSTIAVEISASAEGRSENISIGSIIADNFGASSENHSVVIGDTDYVHIGSIEVTDARAVGVILTGPTFSHIGSIIIRDNVDEGTNAHHAVVIAAPATDNIIDSILVENWTFAVGNGAGVEIQGDRNQIGKIRVENADSWDLSVTAAAADNVIGRAILSGHGTGGLNNAGTQTLIRELLQAGGTGIYKPHRSKGTATITSAATSIAVTHGLAVTPTAGDCLFMGAENPTTDVGTLWIDTYTSTQFTANVENAPGASNFDIVWQCSVY